MHRFPALFVLLVLVTMALAMPNAAGAFPRSLDFHDDNGRVVVTPSVSLGRLGGDTLYKIGGDFNVPGQAAGTSNFTLSELEFPLDVYTASAGLSVVLSGRLQLRLGLTRNLTSDAGSMQDSDWGVWYLNYGYPYSPDTLDISSESRTDLEATMFQSDVLFRLLATPAFTLAAGVGYHYQNFHYELSDLDQWYPSYYYYTGENAAHDRVYGPVGSYDVSFHLVMLEGAAEVRPWPDFSIWCLVGVAPYARAQDEDNHILRAKRSEGDATGTAVLLDLGIEYRLPAGVFIGLGYEYQHISTSGTQTQTWYRTTSEANAGDWLTIDQEIESSQHAIDLTLGLRF